VPRGAGDGPAVAPRWRTTQSVQELKSRKSNAETEPFEGLLRARPGPPQREAGVPLLSEERLFISPGAGVNSSQAAAANLFGQETPSQKMQRKGPRNGPQIESNESRSLLQDSEHANNSGASVPPLRAGEKMEARVDCGYAYPPCVSALVCRCSRAHLPQLLGLCLVGVLTATVASPSLCSWAASGVPPESSNP
jgi:hypothetical protein